MKINSIEEIYPCTIVKMRYADKWIIFESLSHADFISTAVEDEEVSFDIEHWLEEMLWSYAVNFGIGKDIWCAFEDYKLRYELKSNK